MSAAPGVAHLPTADGWCEECSTGAGPVYHNPRGEHAVQGAPRLAAMTVASARQIDHWTRKGWIQANIPAPGTGRPLIYSAEEVRVAKIMARLVTAGLTPDRAAEVARSAMWWPYTTLGPGLSLTILET
jgi:hypothetical protein